MDTADKTAVAENPEAGKQVHGQPAPEYRRAEFQRVAAVEAAVADSDAAANSTAAAARSCEQAIDSGTVEAPAAALVTLYQ